MLSNSHFTETGGSCRTFIHPWVLWRLWSSGQSLPRSIEGTSFLCQTSWKQKWNAFNASNLRRWIYQRIGNFWCSSIGSEDV